MMLFLKLLFFTSTFYVALARPEVSCNDTEVPMNATTVPEEPEPPQTDESYKQNQQDFLSAIIAAVDQYLTLILSPLDINQQNEFKNLGVNYIISDMNYLCLLAQASEYKNSLGPNDTNSWDKDDIEIELESPDSSDLGPPYIPEYSDETI